MHTIIIKRKTNKTQLTQATIVQPTTAKAQHRQHIILTTLTKNQHRIWVPIKKLVEICGGNIMTH